MAFSNNILPTEAAYYTLNNATIKSTTLSIGTGGSAFYKIDETVLAALPKSFSFNYRLISPLDIEPNIKVQFTFVLSNGTRQSFTIFPTSLTGNIYMITIDTKDGEYTSCTIKLTSDVNCSMSLWELCPEASDSDIETVIDNVKQSLPRVLYDYNTWPFTVEQVESTVALITCRLKGDTDIQGHFLMNFTASEQAIVTLRFYDNEGEELFAPLTYDIHAGYNTIDVPHAFLTRLTGLHTFAVTAQTTAGTLSMDTRGVLFTIDGGYLASREITIGLNVRDLAIKQTNAATAPEEIWLVGIDENEILVRKRSYSDQNTNVSFDPVASIGEGIDAAIEFDGNWVLRAGANQYTLETEAEPWIFYVDKENNLYGKHGVTSNEVSILLDTEVTQVRACRGYSSIEYVEQDQGLIVVYLKNGIAYYRNYSYNVTAQEVRWSDPTVLYETTEAILSVNIHRLNDYRVVVEISCTDNNYLLISSRTYVGQSIYPEIWAASGEAQIDQNYPQLIGYYTDKTYPIVSVIDASYEASYDDTGNPISTLALTYDHQLLLSNSCFDPNTCFAYSHGDYINVISWDIIGNTTVIKLTVNVNITYINFVITLKGNTGVRYPEANLIYALTSDVVYTYENALVVSEVTSLKSTITSTIKARGIETTTLSPKEIFNNNASISGSITFNKVNSISIMTEEKFNTTNTYLGTVAYYKSGEEPI